MTRTITFIACMATIVLCAWHVVLGRMWAACAGLAGVGLLLIDLGSRPQGKPTKEPIP